MMQPALDFGAVPQSLPARSKFHGETYDAELDYARLNRAERAVFNAMYPGEWLTLGQIRDRTMYASEQGYSEAGISARIRGLRAMGFTIERKRLSGGLWVYRLILSGEEAE